MLDTIFAFGLLIFTVLSPIIFLATAFFLFVGVPLIVLGIAVHWHVKKTKEEKAQRALAQAASHHPAAPTHPVEFGESTQFSELHAHGHEDREAHHHQLS